MSSELQWKKHAKQTAYKINLGWWMQTLAAPLLIASLVTACITLLARREFATVSDQWLLIASGIAVTLLGAASFFIARRRFETADESLVRIEAKMKLKNTLTVANQGLSKWPELPTTINDGVKWHWRRLLPPFLGALIIFACGFLIPIQAGSSSDIEQQPNAWTNLESSLEVLEDQELVQEEYIDETRKKLEELRQQSPEEWFSHSSLEATDNLLETHANEQQQLKNSLENAEHALDSLQNQSANMSPQQKQQLMNDLDQALKKMEEGAMKPNKELLKQLKKLDPSQLTQIDPSQLDQLRKNMCQQAQKLGQNLGDQGSGAEGQGQGEGSESSESEQNGDDKQGLGKGGVGRGPGHAPNPLGETHLDTGAGKHEGLQSDDHRNARPGDLLETSDGEHDVDKTSRAPHEGGATQSTGKGGNHVWKDSLMPNEKKALKNFFE